jgi:hypothetical protein
MKTEIKIGARLWSVTAVDSHYILTLKDAPEAFAGRTLKVTSEGVWECSRDGKETPLALIDASSQVFDRLKE